MTKNVIVIIHSDFTKSENADQNSNYPTMTNNDHDGTLCLFIRLQQDCKTAILKNQEQQQQTNKNHQQQQHTHKIRTDLPFINFI